MCHSFLCGTLPDSVVSEGSENVRRWRLLLAAYSHPVYFYILYRLNISQLLLQCKDTVLEVRCVVVKYNKHFYIYHIDVILKRW